MSQTNVSPQISGTLPLFQRPELLNKEAHSELGLQLVTAPFKFAAKIRAIPVTMGEISMAMKSYPIVFSSADKPMTFAVVGAVDDVNLFVDEDGNWEETAYVPGYIRRYPFATASDETGDRMAVVLDVAHEGIGPGGEEPLFQNGEPTEKTQAAIDFCRDYEADRRRTEQAMAKLAEFNLISGQTIHYTPAGSSEQQPFAQYFSVDEKRLNELPDDQFLEIRKSGALPFVYAHLLSFTNWRMLMGRRARRFNLTDETLLHPQTLN